MELGPGVIILLVTWVTTAFTWALFLRSYKEIRIIVTTLASMLTITLVLIPTESNSSRQLNLTKQNYAYDYLFIWKVILIIILCLSIIAAIATIISTRWTLKVHGSDPVPKVKGQQWATVRSTTASGDQFTNDAH